MFQMIRAESHLGLLSLYGLHGYYYYYIIIIIIFPEYGPSIAITLLY